MPMTARLRSKLIAALLAPALLVSGAAQGLLFMRCGESVRMSCCCASEAPPEPSAAIDQAAPLCCSQLAVPTVPARSDNTGAPVGAAPTLLALLTPATTIGPTVERGRVVPLLDPAPGPSLVLVHCAFLI